VWVCLYCCASTRLCSVRVSVSVLLCFYQALFSACECVCTAVLQPGSVQCVWVCLYCCASTRLCSVRVSVSVLLCFNQALFSACECVCTAVLQPGSVQCVWVCLYCCASTRLCSVRVRRMTSMHLPRRCATTTQCQDSTRGILTCCCVSRKASKASRTCYEARTRIFLLLNVLHRLSP